jgi:hypothetical protein
MNIFLPMIAVRKCAVQSDAAKINYHPQSGWFEDAPLKGGAVWYAPTGGAVVGSPLQRAL